MLINRRRHYRGQFGSDRGPLAPRAVGPFRVKRVLTLCTLELEIPLAVRGRAVPVFHSSDMIPYETRVLDPEGMLPEVAGEDEPGGDDGGGGTGDGPGGGSGGEGWGSRKLGKRRARSEDPENPPLTPEEATGADEGATGNEPTMRDKIREMEWRHATGVEDRETSLDEERLVRDDDK